MTNGQELQYADYRASTYRPAFDGLRGIGFLMVVTAHIPSVPLFSYLQGWTAVWVFFAISGYLVTMLLMREEAAHGRIAFGPFLIKRFFRIVPSYAAAVLIYWAALYGVPALSAPPGLNEYDLFVARLPYYLTLMPEYAHTNVFTIFVHSWTVGIEVKFYIFFTAVVFLFMRRDDWRFAITALTTLALTIQGSFTANAYCAILFGVMLAQILEHPRAYAVVARLTRVPAAVPLAFVAALFWMLLYTEVLPAVAVVATYLVAYAMLQTGMMRRVLTFAPLVYLGQRSYGAYLLHVLAVHTGYLWFGGGTVTGGFLTACFALLVTVPAAEIMYRVIEKPGADLGRRILDALKPSGKTRAADAPGHVGRTGGP